MKRWIFALMSMVVLLGLTACGASLESQDPEASPPEEIYDLVYDMQDYDFFAWIFDEKPLEEWTAMGRYTMLLKGLHTPVVVNMDGTDVLTISAFDRTVELGEAGLATDYDNGFSAVYYIGSTQDAVVIRISCGEYGDDSIVITKEQTYSFLEEDQYQTNFYIQEDGTLRYRRTWNDPIVFEQMGYYALEHCTDRDEILYETGRADIGDQGLVLTGEETVVLSDEIDLDALFAEGKEAGEYEQYETLDDLLAANQAKANEPG